MAKLSITTAWNETAGFVKQEAGHLFVIAFALMVLPSIVLQVLMPGMMTPAVATAGGITAPQFAPGSLALFIVGILVVVVLSLWGNLTITVLALRQRSVIGDAFRAASGRILPLVGASIMLGILAALLCLPIIFMARSSMATGHAPGGGFVLLLLVYMLLFIFVAVRMMLMTPTAAAEAAGPVGIIRRSWQLTAGHFWKLLGFFLLLILVLLVVMMVVGAIFGILIALLFGAPTPGSLASMLVLLVSGIVEAVFVMIFATLLARIYEQLAGDAGSAAEVFQ